MVSVRANLHRLDRLDRSMFLVFVDTRASYRQNLVYLLPSGRLNSLEGAPIEVCHRTGGSGYFSLPIMSKLSSGSADFFTLVNLEFKSSAPRTPKNVVAVSRGFVVYRLITVLRMVASSLVDGTRFMFVLTFFTAGPCIGATITGSPPSYLLMGIPYQSPGIIDSSAARLL